MSYLSSWSKLMNHTFSDSLKNAAKSCKNFVFKGDVNIDIGILNSYNSKLEQFPSLCNLKSLIKKETCITKGHKSTTNLISTNKKLKNWISDHHSFIATALRSQLVKANAKMRLYLGYKAFKIDSFSKDLKGCFKSHTIMTIHTFKRSF